MDAFVLVMLVVAPLPLKPFVPTFCGLAPDSQGINRSPLVSPE